MKATPESDAALADACRRWHAGALSRSAFLEEVEGLCVTRTTRRPAALDPLSFFQKDGEIWWRCLRCASEHLALGAEPCHSIKVGADCVGFCCNGCRDVVKSEIRALVPEGSFHGVPDGENDPGWPEGTPLELQRR